MFVIYHRETTKILRPNWMHDGYKTETSAKAALTREVNKNGLNRDDYAISDEGTFFSTIEKKVKKKSHVSPHEEIEVGVNTPACCDPSTETYWAM